MEIETEAPPTTMGYKSLTDGQEMLLALLPIPSGILGVMGSWIVIQMAFRMRKVQSWSAYQALLTGMSVCTIFYTITNMLGPFLYPKKTSTKVWAFGNEASCKTIGAMNQFGTSVMLYEAMLSWYFVLVIRFGLANEDVIDRFETTMHVLAVGWPLLSSFLGLFLEVYGERQTSLGCYIDECPFDENGERIICAKSLFLHILGRVGYIFTFLCLIFSSIVNSRHLRRQLNQDENITGGNAAEGEMMAAESDDTFVRQDSDLQMRIETTSSEEIIITREVARHRKQRNLHDVRTQAILFVVGFALCNVPTYLLNFTVGDVRRIDLSTGTSISYEEEMELPYKYYAALVLQSLLLPLQGFVNCVIYVRPQYIVTRRHFRQESRLWACRRAVYGDVIVPTVARRTPEPTSIINSTKKHHPRTPKVRPRPTLARGRSASMRVNIRQASTRVLWDGSKRSDVETDEVDHSNEDEDHP